MYIFQYSYYYANKILIYSFICLFNLSSEDPAENYGTSRIRTRIFA